MPMSAPYPYERLWVPVGTDPRVNFHDKFQRKMEECDWDFEKKHGGDLDTTLIFVSVCSRTGGGTLRTAWDLVLTMRYHTVWFILGCNVGVHYQCTIGAHTGLRANEQHVTWDAP